MSLDPRYVALTAVAPTVAAAGLLAIASSTPGPSPDPRAHGAVGAASTPPADHHVHVWSRPARDLLVRAQEELGQEVISAEQARVLSGSDAVAALDSAGVERGVLLSTAYFFGIPDVEVEEEREKVRAENDYVARQAEAHPHRLVAFLSVNPMADYAVDEIERMGGREAVVGLKLHLGNSNVSLRDSAEVARLREVFARANERGLAIAVHLGGRSPDFGAEDAEAFLNEVLPAAPDVSVQVAHMGGPGGFGPGTRAAADAFAAALEDHPERTEKLFFDLSGVPHPTYVARGDSTLERRIAELNRAFVETARAIGFDRIVYGTDWPAISMPRYLAGIRAALPLAEEEFRDLVDDPAPYLLRARDAPGAGP